MILTTPDNNFSDGFTDDLDLFGRKPLFEQIMRVALQAPDENLVLALEDKWGNGKSTFVKMMTSEIKSNHDNLNVIYFDAYENDYQSDPFISLSSVIYEMVENDKKLTSMFGEKLLSASKKIGLSVLSHTAKFAISTATANLLTTTAIEKASDAIAESLTNPLEEYVADKIKSAKNERNNIVHFKETLEEIHARTQKKTLIIID
ncbi:TPA: P-loop NTPase fold protein, partial [Klebsiella quasipneumoniae]